MVLYPDSYGSRGLGSQCTVRNRSVRTDRERVGDANAARHWLQNQPYVEADKVALLGWSNGGNSVLWAVRRRSAVPKDDTSDFRSAVALYPGCRRLDNAAWSARIPTLILIGAADDWTSAQACQQMVAGARGRSAGTSIVVYPGAYHDFDHPNRPLQVRSGYAFTIRRRRQGPHRHQSGRTRRRAQARPAMARAVSHGAAVSGRAYRQPAAPGGAARPPAPI